MPRPRELDVNFSASGDNIIIPGQTGYRIIIWRMWIEFKGPTSIKIRDGVGGTFLNTEPLDFDVGGIWELDFSRAPHWQTSRNNAFVINSSAAQIVTGRIFYTLERMA